jgi:hypothetical protein
MRVIDKPSVRTVIEPPAHEYVRVVAVGAGADVGLVTAADVSGVAVDVVASGSVVADVVVAAVWSGGSIDDEGGCPVDDLSIVGVAPREVGTPSAGPVSSDELVGSTLGSVVVDSDASGATTSIVEVTGTEGLAAKAVVVARTDVGATG